MRRPFLILCAVLCFGGLAASAPPGGRCESPACQCETCDAKCRCCYSAAAEAFTPGGPVSPDGTRATVDIPAARHIRNVGGSDGAGLCVFTSIQLGADWQNVRELDGFREWMRRRPGGGWPEKVDQMLSQFCRERGATVPAYVQHTGGDEAFLERALATRRAVCVTYAGRDDFYRGPIAHMVNLVYLDATRAAIIDNNRPGVWVWMTRAEFLQRWRAMQGGWAFVLLAPPPPPHKANAWLTPVGQCPGGCCPLPTRIAPTPAPEPDGPFEWDAPRYDAQGEYRILRRGGRIVGAWWGGGFHREVSPGQFATDATPAPTPPPTDGGEVRNFGVVPAKIHSRRWYSLNGCEVDRDAALGSFGDELPADGDRFYLTAVGDAAFLATARDAIAKLPPADRGRFHLQTYAPDHWAVGHFGLTPGVSIRKPTGGGDSSAEVASVPPAGFTLEELIAIVDLALRFRPKPDPKPNPVRPDPKPPEPAPCPGGECPLRRFAPWLFVAALALRSLFRSPKPKEQP
jgi:hypothetical protein